jgi:hypothetical protein
MTLGNMRHLGVQRVIASCLSQTTDNFFRLFAKVPRPQRSAA